MARVRVPISEDSESSSDREAGQTKKTVAIKLPALSSASAKSLFLRLAIIVFLGLVIILFVQRQQLEDKVDKLENNTSQVSPNADEAQKLTGEIGKYIELPNEAPTVVTVADANKVKGQTFFVAAQDGDKVLLFAKAGKAILYRPSTKKVIEMASINLDQQAQQPAR